MTDDPMRLAVTGAAGFVGSRLSSFLLSQGHDVVAISRQPDSCDDVRREGAEVRVADVRIPAQIDSALEGVDGVFHIAALFNHPDRTWDDYRDVNVTGTVNVLRAAKQAGAKKVVHCSTVGVATEASPPPYDEDIPYSPQPNDKYEASKADGEKAALAFAAQNDLRLTVIRPAQIYGPGDRSKAKFYKLIKKGVIVSPGQTMKHLIYIDDLCRAFLMAMTRNQADGEVFLIAGKRPVELKELIDIAATTLGVPSPKVKLPAAPVVFACTVVENVCNLLRVKPLVFRRSMDFFVKSVECDTSKSSEMLGFQSEVGVNDGIRFTVDWLRGNQLI
jgi:nucleoside-diphosphate-sugar epimerase